MTKSEAAGFNAAPRVLFIEGIRAVAALYVVLSHIGSLVDPSRLAGTKATVSPSLHWITGLFSKGNLAVATFIVTSGFCLRMASVRRRDSDLKQLAPFFKKRVARIFPAYYGALAVAIPVALLVSQNLPGLPFNQYVPLNSGVVLSHLLMVQNLNPEWMYKIDGVMWSIAIEFQLYFLFPVLSRALKSWYLAAIMVLLLGAASIGIASLIPHGLKFYPYFAVLFFIGMIAYDVRKMTSLLLAGFTAVALGLTVYFIWTAQANWWQDCGIGFLTAGVLSIGTSEHHLAVITKPFEPKVLVWIGSFSYSLYLLHHPVLQVLAWVWVHSMSPSQSVSSLHHGQPLLYLLTVGTAASIFLSYWFAHLFERKWVRNWRELFARPPAASSTNNSA